MLNRSANANPKSLSCTISKPNMNTNSAIMNQQKQSASSDNNKKSEKIPEKKIVFKQSEHPDCKEGFIDIRKFKQNEKIASDLAAFKSQRLKEFQ